MGALHRSARSRDARSTASSIGERHARERVELDAVRLRDSVEQQRRHRLRLRRQPLQRDLCVTASRGCSRASAIMSYSPTNVGSIVIAWRAAAARGPA